MERTRRGADASEADLAVLQHQLAPREPLAPDDMTAVLTYDADVPFERARPGGVARGPRAHRHCATAKCAGGNLDAAGHARLNISISQATIRPGMSNDDEQRRAIL